MKRAKKLSPENSITIMPPEIPRDKFEGFVLAGGKSSRMGANKAFLKIENETFLERAVKTLTPICQGRVKIILNSNQSAADFSSFDFIRDVFAERGALGGIHAALVNSKTEWTIILACDLPLMTSEKLAELSKIALDSPPKIAAVVPVQTDGKIQPLSAIYRAALCRRPLEELLRKTASASARDFLKLIPTTFIETEKTLSTDEKLFFNVNRPEDYNFLLNK